MEDIHLGSKTRATIMINRPESGRFAMQEPHGKASKKLRAAIEAAHAAFWNAYEGKTEVVTKSPFKEGTEPTREEINLVADAISEEQGCSSCAGIKPEDKHCEACTKEAQV